MANKNITIPVKDIKAVMRDWYEEYFEGNDESYEELIGAIRTFHNAGLITEEDYKKLFEYGNKLFKIVCEA